MTNGHAKYQLREGFSPSSPINSVDLFSGRQDQVGDILAAINQTGQHAVLFGEGFFRLE